VILLLKVSRQKATIIFLINLLVVEYIYKFSYSVSSCCEAVQIYYNVKYPLRNEPLRNLGNCCNCRRHDSDGGGICNTTTGFGVQTPQQSQQSQQQHKS
jgi:hypothetical protein